MLLGFSRAPLPGVSGLLQRAFLSYAAQGLQPASAVATRYSVSYSADDETDWEDRHGEISEDHWSGADDYLTDLTTPASWYPAARRMQRTIIAHMGPTNSGKTYQALQALKEADSGAYCGPLRLLAWEIAEKMNAAGLPFDLVTGQEQRLMQGARHIASTVEMASVTREIQVGVVDEVQMVGDPVRGASFTRAVLGLPAKVLHVCGDPAALPLLRLLAMDTGDVLEVREYERLAPLAAARRALPSLRAARRGDCLVAFSRRDVHSIKRQVEAGARHSCCVVYGALPPESRAQQAVLFNTDRTGYNVLAASDAVGMGLNLNIRRIVFTSLEKFDGVEQRPLTPAEIKQIAGRAGRFGSKYESGLVTCLNQDDMRYLRQAMMQQNPDVERACLFPRYEQIALFIHQNPHHSLPTALHAFAGKAVLAEHYFLGDFDNIYELALMLRHLRLTLREHYLFSISPTDASDPPVASALLSFATAYSSRGLVPGRMCSKPPSSPPKTELALQHLEALHRIYDLYVWLAFRMEDAVPDRKPVEAWRAQCSDMIRQGLENLGTDGSTWRTQQEPVVPGNRAYSTAAGPGQIRHFPKHLLHKPGEPPRSPLPGSASSGGDTGNDDFDPKAPLVKPERPKETRSERRVRKREEGQARVVERDFGRGILPPFSDDEPNEPEVQLRVFGPGMQPKKKKQGAKRKSSKPGPFPIS